MDLDHTYADYIDEKGVSEIEALEKAIGKRLLAFYTPPEAAPLTKAEKKKIQDLEKKLCVRLVAYETQ
jgi:hypothetical protein